MDAKLVTLLLVFAAVEMASSCMPAQGSTLKIGSFNVKQLGQSKFSKPDVMQNLYQIMGRYDMLLMQEITDVSLKILPDMLRQLNAIEKENPFKYQESQRLGRSDQKEQYVLWYRSGISVVKTYQYPDPQDVFEREPFLVVVSVPHGRTVKTFGTINIHVKPSDAKNEINALPEVYDYYRQLLGLDDMIIAGDLNADCSYITMTELANTKLRSDSRFVWLIPDDADTTTISSTDCAYDRIIVAGPSLISTLDKCPATVFEFDKAYNLLPSYAPSVSDHYPVEVDMLATDWNRRSRA